MANPPKQKGTDGETELLRMLNSSSPDHVFKLRRNAPNSIADLRQDQFEGEGGLDFGGLELLATRPDRGQWLITMNVDNFIDLMYSNWVRTGSRPEIDIEVKRYKRFSLHGIFEKKFKEVMKILAYCDGASFSTAPLNGDILRVGPSGVGVAYYYEDRIPDDNFPPFDTLCIPIGIKTNNDAEYRAVIDAIEYWMMEMDHAETFDPLVIRSDSQLVVNQINGRWKVKNERLLEYHTRVMFLISLVTEVGGRIDFEWIPREQNMQADALSKAAAGLAADEVR